jgi:hypothetical protein
MAGHRTKPISDQEKAFAAARVTTGRKIKSRTARAGRLAGAAICGSAPGISK